MVCIVGWCVMLVHRCGPSLWSIAVVRRCGRSFRFVIGSLCVKYRSNLSSLVVVIAGSVAAVAAPSFAQDTRPNREERATSEVIRRAEGTDSGGRKWDATFSLWGNYGFQSDLNDTTGDVSINHVGAQFDLSIPLGGGHGLGFGVSTEWTSFNFSDNTTFGSLVGLGGPVTIGVPWDDVWTHTVSGRYVHVFDNRWSAFAGLGVASSGEAGADFSETIEVAGFGGASYRFSDQFSLGGGLLVSSQLEDDTQILPLVLVTWKPSDKWTVGTSALGGRGGGLSVGYAPNDQWTLALQAGFRSMNFRLDDDGELPNAVGRLRGSGVQFRVDYKISSQVTLAGYGGVYLGRELILDDAQGERVFKTDVDPMPYVGAQIEFKF
jgi:hypothetical protein